MANTSVEGLINDTLVLCQNTLKSDGVKLNLEIEDFPFNCKSIQMAQAILNLIHNSIDHIRGQKLKWIKIKTKVTPESHQVQIIDSGEGIAQENLDRIFNLFYTTKPTGVGTGLGLSVSQNIIKEHGGTLYYEKHEGNTSFVMNFPRKAEQKKAA